DVLLKAAQRRIPFFVDPPGAVDFPRGCLYGKAVAEAKLISAIGFRARSTDVVQEAREYLGTNKVPLMLGWWLHPPTEDPGSSAVELLWTEACQLVDVFRLFCGDVTRVRALAAGGGADRGGLVLQLEFATGTIGMLTCATFARPEPRIQLEMLGEGW